MGLALRNFECPSSAKDIGSFRSSKYAVGVLQNIQRGTACRPLFTEEVQSHT